MLKDLSGPSPLVNLFFKTKTKKITVVQYQNEKRRMERRPIKTPPHTSSYPKTSSVIVIGNFEQLSLRLVCVNLWC